MSLHPASLIVLWLAFLFAAAAITGDALFLCFAITLAVTLLFAGVHLRLLVRRSRWLLLTMLLLFGWMTPGTPVALVPGASLEGLQLAAEHGTRLLLALCALALMLRLLSPVQLVTGIRTLLAPFAPIGMLRDRVAVRLALTLEEVERSIGNGGNDDAFPLNPMLHLPATSCGRADVGLGLVSTALIGLAVWL